MAAACRNLVEADISHAQLRLALARKNAGARDLSGMIVSAFRLPLGDGSVDGVVCARLSHHLPEAAERGELLDELLRIAKRFVIFSFVDRLSMKSIARRIRLRELNPSAMTLSEISEIARRRGARVKKCLAVSNLGSRHRYALIEKE
jgi:hypothetical protein